MPGPSVARLAGDPDERARMVAAYEQHFGNLFGRRVRRDIAALWLLQDLAWGVAATAVGGMPAGGAVVLVPAAGITVRLPRDEPVTVAVDLADVRLSDGGYPGARRHLSATLGPVVAALLPDLAAGPRAGWACVTDMASAVLWTASVRARLDPAEEVGRFAAATGDPRDQLLDGLRVRASPRLGTIRVRHGCCLIYAVPAPLCESCPRLP